MPQVSVIIPTYNHQDFVLATLESVFAQTFTDFEIIIVNDGSPDKTAEVLRPLAEAGRIRYIDQPNAGQAVARNRGIAEAQGEFIAFLDDDDLWPADKLEWQVATLSSHPEAVLVYGIAESFGDSVGKTWPDKEAPSGEVLTAFLNENSIVSPGQTLARLAALKEIGQFDSKLWGIDDWDLYIRLAGVGNFIFEEKLALKYRLHSANASRNIWRMYVNNLRMVKKYLNEYRIHNLNQGPQNVTRYYANHCIRLAWESKGLGNRRDFTKMLWTAFRIHPPIFLGHCWEIVMKADPRKSAK